MNQESTVSLPLAREPYVAVANVVIGRTLAAAPRVKDGASPNAEASKSRIHLLRSVFIKALCEQWPSKDRRPEQGFAANRIHQKNRFGTSEWSFRQAQLACRRALGGFNRKQQGRGYATEESLPKGGGEVRLPISAVQNLPAKVLAFVVVVLLKPEPLRPRDVGKLIGLVDDEVLSRLACEAAKTGLIERYVGTRNTVYVGRPRNDRSEGSTPPINHPPRKHPPEKCLAQSNRKEVISTESENIQDSNTALTSREPSYGSDLVLRCWRSRLGEDDDAGKWWDRLTRSDFAWPTNIELFEAPHSLWTEMVERLGPVPSHLTTPFAYAQGVDISRELVARLHDCDLEAFVPGHSALRQVMVGFAAAVSAASHRGDNIRNFSYLAKNLLHRVEQGDDTWQFGFKSHLDADTARIHLNASERLAGYAHRMGHDLNVRRLTSTLGFEELHQIMVQKGGLEDGFDAVVADIRETPIENTVIVERWTYFGGSARRTS